MKSIVCFGEVLWDIFPNGKKLGGAPFNVCQRLSSFGHKAKMISAIGKDDLGENIMRYFDQKNLTKEYLQVSDQFPTGQVLVSLDAKGSPSYEILQPVSWDYIEYSESLGELISDCDAFVFGSLAARNSTSKQTLLQLIDKSNFSVFDLNLRAPFYSLEFICDILKKVNFAKFNDEEIIELAEYITKEVHDVESAIHCIQNNFDLEHLCITLGSEGATYIVHNKRYSFSGFEVEVADTVGAGDSFLAGLIHQLLIEAEPGDALKFACAIGAMVAASEGANPDLDMAQLSLMLKQ